MKYGMEIRAINLLVKSRCPDKFKSTCSHWVALGYAAGTDFVSSRFLLLAAPDFLFYFIFWGEANGGKIYFRGGQR